MIHACLIGAGRMGRDHAKHIHHSPDAKLYSVVDLNKEAAESVASEYGAKAFTSAEEALADPSVDAVVIATSTDTHTHFIKLAAKAGKPICCEKPIDLSLEKTDECLSVVESCGVPLFVAFNRRFDPSFSRLWHELRSGVVGDVEQVIITSRDYRLPAREYLQRSGLLFRDMTIHDFDMARWLLQEELTEVFAMGSRLVDPTIEEFGDVDTAALVLKSESGATVQIVNSRRCLFGYDQRIEVAGAKGMVRANNLVPHTVEVSTEQSIREGNPHPSFPQRYREAYQHEMDHFFTDVVKGGKPPAVDGRAARQALVIAEAATLSFEEGRSVTIPSPEEALALA